MDWIEALTLGVVQGLTEFLPVSSDGHLVLAQKAFGWWHGKQRDGAADLFFDVMLHVGTLAAILVHYRAVGRTGAKGLLGSEEVPPAYRRPAVVRVGILACVATLPLVPYALFFKHFVEKSMESLHVTGWGFVGTATALLLTTWLSRSESGKGPSEMTWLDALLIGLAQMLAPLPGVSRSGLTVAAALGLGLSRAWAIGFSLLIAIPAILGAAVFELKDINPHAFSLDRVAKTLAAATVAGLVGYGAIRWLVKVVRAGRLWYFSVYLVVLAVGVLTLAPADVTAPGGSTHARARRLWTGPFGSVLREQVLRAAKVDESSLWIVPSPPAREQLLRELGKTHRGGFGLRVWCWNDVWQAVLEGSDGGPAVLSAAAARAVLGEAIGQAQREGALAVLGEVVGWPGFRRRLRGRVGAWTRGERPIDGPPPDESATTADEWAIHQRYRRLLSRIGAEDEDGLSVWASRQLQRRPPAALRKLGAAVLLDMTATSRASWRALEFMHAKARTVDVSVPYADDETLAEVFCCTRGLRDRLLGLGFAEQADRSDDGLLTPGGLYSLALDVLRSDAHRRPKRQACPGLTVVGAPRGEGTGLLAARRVKDLLEQDIAPEEILVLFPEWDDGAEVVLETFQAWGLPAGAEAPRPLGLDPAVGLLRLAATLGTEGWQTSALIQVLRHGLVRPAWPEARLPLARAAAAWALRATRVFRGVEPLRAALARDSASDDPRRAARASTAQEVVEPLFRLIETLDRPRSWDRQCDRLRALADALGLLEPETGSLWDALQDHAMILAEIGVGDRDWTWSDFTGELKGLAADLVPPPPPAPSGVVRLLTLADAAGMVAEHVLLVNLAEGTLPSRAAVDPDLPLLDPEEDAPPPPANPALARESHRFLQAVGAARSGLDIVYPMSDEQGQPLLKAGFLEDMLDRFTSEARERLDEQVTRIDPAHRERPDLAGATREACVRAVALACDGDPRLLARLAGNVALRPMLAGTASAIRVEHDRTRLRTFGPYDGRLADPAAIAAIGRSFGPDNVLSPSQLETFISCPFQFFLRYVVRLDALDERDELDEDYTGRGSILHGILEELEQRLLHEPADRLDLSRELMQERLKSESTVVSEIDGGLRAIEHFRIDQMLTRYARQHEKYEQAGDSGAARPHRFEVVFGDDRRSDSHPCLVIGEGDEAVRLQGKIDRIDLVTAGGSEGFRVIDYKTGSCPSAKDVTGALYVQLPLYALAVERIVLLERQPQLVDVGYWGLKKEGYRRIVLKHWAQDQAAFEAYVIALARLIRGGQFVVNSRREDCTKFCEFSAVCRIRQVRSVGKERDGFPTLEWLDDRPKRESVDE